MRIRYRQSWTCTRGHHAAGLVLIALALLLTPACSSTEDIAEDLESFVCLDGPTDCVESPSEICAFDSTTTQDPLGFPIWARIEKRSANIYTIFAQPRLEPVTAKDDIAVFNTSIHVTVFAGTDLIALRPQLLQEIDTAPADVLSAWLDGIVCTTATNEDPGAFDLGLASSICGSSTEASCFDVECVLEAALVNGAGRVITGRDHGGNYLFITEQSTRPVTEGRVLRLKRTTYWIREFGDDFQPTGDPVDFEKVRDVFPAAGQPAFDGQLDIAALPNC